MNEHSMNLRKDLYDINEKALFVYLVIASLRNTNYLNNTILELSSRDYSNADYLDAIKSINDTKKKAIIDINNAAYIAISQTNQLTTEIKVIAEDAKLIAQDAKLIAQDAKLIAQNAKLIAEDAKQLVDIISTNQSGQYSTLSEKIHEAYNLAIDAKNSASAAKNSTDETKLLVDALSSKQDEEYTDLLERIDFIFNEIYRLPSSTIIKDFDMRP
jgi:hypothetical protein